MADSLLRATEAELLSVFRSSADKHEAHARATPILERLSREPSFLSAVLAKYLASPGSLDKKNYPVVGIDVALNPWFSLMANCWIPLPSGETHLSTKAIHHHGTMLLSTVTLFGPGYEHLMFTRPRPVAEGSKILAMSLLEAAPHPLHHVAFVDEWIPHVPLYPASLSITLALWSSSSRVTWTDRVKRLPLFHGREKRLRELARRVGLTRRLALKVVESFDFYPEDDGFRAIPERVEFALGPNEDHLHGVFHVVQRTGNERLASVVRRSLDTGKVKAGRPAVERLLALLEKGTPIEGRLSKGHVDRPGMNFTRAAIEKALAATARETSPHQGESHGRKFASEAPGKAPPRARPR
jgi:hypothetical protein